MECDICVKRRPGLGFHCPACARSAIYSLRIDHAKTLLEKEALGRQVAAIVTRQSSSKLDGVGASGTASQISDNVRAFDRKQDFLEIARSREKVEKISQQAAILRERIDNYKKEVLEKRAAAAQCRARTESATAALEPYRPVIEALRKRIKKTAHRHELLYNEVTSSRVYLCKEAASLAGLKQRQGKSKDGKLVEYYTLGGIEILDLRDLNNASPQHVNTCLDGVARLVSLCCQYLQVRLPAEVVLPHRDRPLCLLIPSSSYMTLPSILSDKTRPSRSSGASPYASHTLDRHGLRALHLDRKLPALAKDNPAAYSSFVEAVTLLAWDIVWLCRTQGLAIGSEHWGEVCTVGRNLWLLLVPAGRPRLPLLQKIMSSKDVPLASKPAATGDGSIPDAMSTGKAVSALGVLSHGTAHQFLGSASSYTAYGCDVSARGWVLAAPIKIVDKLKSHLLAEASGQEWEMLNESEYASHVELTEDDPVLLAARRTKQTLATMSGEVGQPKVAASKTEQIKFDGPGSPDRAEEAEKIFKDGERRISGTNGWTKLKSRGQP